MFKRAFMRVLTVGLVLCMILSLTAMAASGNLKSKASDWKAQGLTNNGNGNGYGNAAKYMIRQQIMKGDGNQNYYLSGYITRGDLMIMLVRAFNFNSNAGGNQFGDVSAADYFSSAVQIARELGIAKGDGKNFLPRNFVTIEQAILFIERAMDHEGIELSVDLEDLYDEDALSDYATREDVCELLYYALTGSTDGFDGEYGSSHGWDSDSESMSVSYSIDEDETVDLDGSDFEDALDEVDDSETLSYVKFTSLPYSLYGVLYSDYDADEDSNTKVSRNTSYDVDELDDITFVPADSFEGTITVSFTAYTEDDNSYRGELEITVGDAESYTADAISYTTDADETVDFDGAEFAEMCESATDETFSYLKFTSLPSSTYGVLYYDYDEDDDNTKVTTSTSYTESKLSRITFVPKSTYSGTVTIAYTGYTTDGTSYTGTVKITVKSVTTADTITYTTGKNTAVALVGTDFAEMCESATDETFSYLKFTSLPSSTYGVLYYDYDEDDDNTKVTTSTSYTESKLSDITFVPKSTYSGTVTISYTGYTEDGTSYTGTVKITVKSVTIADTIAYTTDADEAIILEGSDFAGACEDATGEDFSYLKFTSLPSSTYGVLYYDYDEDDDNTKVTTSTSYTESKLFDITFVPESGYTGTVTFSYKGYTENGTTYTGSVQITVE